VLCAFKASTQRGGAVTKHVGPNGVRPWGEQRSALGRAAFGPGASSVRPWGEQRSALGRAAFGPGASAARPYDQAKNLRGARRRLQLVLRSTNTRPYSLAVEKAGPPG
jgi:hypothetical protein